MIALAPALMVTAAVAAATATLMREFPREGFWRPFATLVAAAIAMTGLAFSLGASPWEAAALGAVAVVAGGIATTDLRRLLVPDTLVLALIVVAVVAPRTSSIWMQASGAVLLSALLLSVRAIYFWRRGTEGLGLGDVKLAAATGFLLGPLIAVQVTASAAIAMIGWSLWAPAGVRSPAPLGAALAVGTVIAMTLSLLGRA